MSGRWSAASRIPAGRPLSHLAEISELSSSIGERWRRRQWLGPAGPSLRGISRSGACRHCPRCPIRLRTSAGHQTRDRTGNRSRSPRFRSTVESVPLSDFRHCDFETVGVRRPQGDLAGKPNPNPLSPRRHPARSPCTVYWKPLARSSLLCSQGLPDLFSFCSF